MQLSIVGIGVSAGVLEAFRLLIAHVPANARLAFVFVQVVLIPARISAELLTGRPRCDAVSYGSHCSIYAEWTHCEWMRTMQANSAPFIRTP
jgi:hypothetical protein